MTPKNKTKNPRNEIEIFISITKREKERGGGQKTNEKGTKTTFVTEDHELQAK